MSENNIPAELMYTKDHEWAQIDDNVVSIGITEYAQDALGEVVFVELPEEGHKVTQGEPFGVVESVKSVSDLYAPISGTVVEVNEALLDSPGQVNDDPYGDGWLIRIEMDSEKELAALMTPADYEKLTKK
jgi:glycine cleavage system H protein